MAQWEMPAATNFLNCACNKTGSGVVMPVDIKWGGCPTPSVPTMAQRGANASPSALSFMALSA